MKITDEDLLAETRELTSRLRAVEQPLEVLRRNRLGGDTSPVRLPQGRDRVVSGVGVRVFTPDRVDGVYLHVHGGGWSFGSADGQDERLWRLAQEARLAVVSVEYRLAPEHPFPAGPDDCAAAARWLAGSAVAEFGTSRLLIGGESAGAHLSVLTVLRLPGVFRAANLVFGAYDLSRAGTARLARTYEQFTPGMTAEQRRSPDVSPLFADLTGVPPARIVVGTEDPLLDDSLALARRWPAPVRLTVVAGAPHGFTLHPLMITERERRREREFLAESGW
ncbi:alpha/beta hydrolase [Nocardia sp. NRRL S-836]|uniref:alpha/beta hydrolase n=1 Tax=Nocardia sp. NRRL S-836 TaxID=1519492 RepID=UPI0006AE6EE9|nr:alpha/beta hydrolase fold domain-containing protein [Nocardia sp. NRRL S-836]KOV85007.1 alpha/beta hydrolase [Nocardia sp. NRRL S-836]